MNATSATDQDIGQEIVLMIVTMVTADPVTTEEEEGVVVVDTGRLHREEGGG